MSTKEILYSFTIYSVLGWLIDTISRSIYHGEWTSLNMLGVPFSPMYGIGALMILYLAPRLRDFSSITQWGMYSAISSLYEYVSGIYSTAILGKRLWDYSYVPWNIHGYTDPFHAAGWGLLALLIIHTIHPRVKAFFSQSVSAQKRPSS